MSEEKNIYRVKRGRQHHVWGPTGLEPLEHPATLELTDEEYAQLSDRVEPVETEVAVVTNDSAAAEALEKAQAEITKLKGELETEQKAKDDANGKLTKAEADVTRLKADLGKVPADQQAWVAEKANLETQKLAAENALADIKGKLKDAVTITKIKGINTEGHGNLLKQLGLE